MSGAMNLAELPDELDRASAIEAAEREESIAAARRAVAGPSLWHCKECGDDIPAERRALGGVTRCIDCAQLYEFQQKQHAK